MVGIEIENIWTWIFIPLDLVAIWLLVQPSSLLDLWTAHRVPASDSDRFIGRLVGAIILWTQVARWVDQVKSGNAHVVLHGLSIVICVCAGVFLGYDFVRLLGSKRNRRAQVGEVKRRAVQSESDQQTRARYKAAWRKYRRLRVAFPLLFLGWLPFGYLLSAVFRFFHWNVNIVMAILLAWVPFIAIVGWQWSFWQCPRCGYAFKGKYDPFFPKHCHYCSLPMWAESPDETNRTGNY